MIKVSKFREGTVVSNKMDKTVVVELERTVSHPFYGKTLTKKKKVKVHDPENKCNIGDLVKVQETKSLSRDKHWKVVDILKSVKNKTERENNDTA